METNNQEQHSTYPSMIKHGTDNGDICKCCGKPLVLGKFAYGQNICYKCFYEYIRTVLYAISFACPTWYYKECYTMEPKPKYYEDNFGVMILNLLDVVGKLYGEDTDDVKE